MRIAKSIARAPVGHTHLWERAMSRRLFLGTTAAAGGAAATAGMWGPLLVDASSVDPMPIPESIFPGTPFHIQFPTAGNELSAINNFKGVVAVAAIAGTGTMTDAAGARTRFFFDSDQRFMQGTYIGANGQRHKGTFGFV